MRCRAPTERFGALAFSWGNAMMKKRTIVYIDGFNLYYGLLRFTSYKWLDIVAFAKSLLPHPEEHEIFVRNIIRTQHNGIIPRDG